MWRCTLTRVITQGMSRWIFIAGLLYSLVFSLLFSTDALADCTFTNGTVNLGTQSSFTAYNSQFRAQGTAGMSCSGVSLALLTANTIKATIQSTANGMKLTNQDGSGDSISYLIYPDANYQYPYTTSQTIDYGGLNLLSLIFQSTSANVPLYIQTTAGANVRAGTYTDTINLTWQYFICRTGALVLCLSNWSGTGSSAVTVTAIITKDCALNSVPNVNFGSKALVEQFNPVTQSITLTCTKTEGYKTYFTAGNNASGGWRRMRSGATSNYLQYQIYVPNTTTVWDANNKQGGSATGLSQSLSYTATVNPAQAAVPVGTYQDSISFVIEY
ncbi:spore coat protein U domain-containing protein [Edaphovirga cremea]|uniref:Csu type fimbrial protein n=1 Tax=Edaphovirga cremea TaxID=2267246 RepID=UPI00398A4D4A